MKRPMIFCAVVCVALSLCVLQIDTTLVTVLATLTFIMFAVLCVFKKTRIYVIVVAAAFLFLLNTARIKINNIDELKILDGQNFTVDAVVTEVVNKQEYSLVDIKVTDSRGMLPDGTKLSLTYYNDTLSVGNEITAEVKLSGIDDSVYKRSNYSSGIFARGYIKKLINKEYGTNIYHSLEKFKIKVNNILFSNMSYEHAAFGAALTVGNSEHISDDFYVDVRRSGVSHVIVVSGLHMAVICGSIHNAFNKIKFNRQASAVLTILFMVFFMALCGFTASVVRAGVMYGIYLSSRIFLKKRDGLNSLSIAVTIMLIHNPFLIWSVGFLLSASATGGIIVILPIMEKYIDRYVKQPILNWLLKASSVTVSALITTLPISAYYFGEVSVVSVFTNILISFAVSVLLVLVVIGITLCIIMGNNFIVSAVFVSAEIVSVYITAVVRFFGNLPLATMACSVWAVIAVYILVIAIFVILKYTYIIKNKKKECLIDGGMLRTDAGKQYKKR